MQTEVIYFIDLFAGIAGFRYGLEKANDTITKRSQQGVQQESRNNLNTIKSFVGTKQFTCIWSNEWNKYARQIYKKYYEKCDERDIRTISTGEIPNHDLLCAGFPCQSFSVAGKRKGFDDTRGTLFFEIARILKDKRPRYFLLENVKGLLSHQEGKTFQAILGILSDLGYRVEWQVLNSKHFGVPQNRERVFIIGHLTEEGGFQVFPIKKNDQVVTKQGFRLQDTQTAISLRATDYKGTHNMIANAVNRIRRLTPIECERLQGFPDNWTEGISDTQRYKCLGNAVTTNVITAIGKKFIKQLEAKGKN